MGVRSPRGARPSLSIPIACYRRHDGPQQGEGADQTACHNGRQGPTLRPWATCHPTHDRPGGAQYKGERPEPLIPPLGDEDGEDVEDDSQSRHAKRGSCLQGVLTRYAVRFFMGNGIRLFSVRHCPSLSDVSTMSELYSMRPDREQKAYKWRLRGLGSSAFETLRGWSFALRVGKVTTRLRRRSYMSEDNKNLSRRFFEEMMSGGNPDWLDEVTSPDYVDHDPVFPDDIHGIEAIKETMSGYLNAFPDLTMTVQDQIAEGDKVFTRWVAEGTHQGEL